MERKHEILQAHCDKDVLLLPNHGREPDPIILALSLHLGITLGQSHYTWAGSCHISTELENVSAHACKCGRIEQNLGPTTSAPQLLTHTALVTEMCYNGW